LLSTPPDLFLVKEKRRFTYYRPSQALTKNCTIDMTPTIQVIADPPKDAPRDNIKKYRVVEVELEDSRRVIIPGANVEIIEE